jgi:hypothetical protein
MKKGGKWWLFHDCFLPPSCDELQEYFDNYDDIIDQLNDTGELVSTISTVADSSDDSLEAFCRRNHAGGGALFDGPPLHIVERIQHERNLERRAEWLEYQSRLRTPELEHHHYRHHPPPALPSPAPQPPPPPPRRAAVNPFAEVRRRKALRPILERTRRIREELRRRHDEGAEEYLF